MLDRAKQDTPTSALREGDGGRTTCQMPSGPTYYMSTIVAGIKAGDTNAIERLGDLCRKGLRYFVVREIGAERADDIVNHILSTVVFGIQSGTVQAPERLVGFVRTTMRLEIASSRVVQRSCDRLGVNLEETLHSKLVVRPSKKSRIKLGQARRVAREVARTSPSNREALCRFYLQGQRPERICDELHIPIAEFRLLCARIRMSFAETGTAWLSADDQGHRRQPDLRTSGIVQKLKRSVMRRLLRNRLD